MALPLALPSTLAVGLAPALARGGGGFHGGGFRGGGSFAGGGGFGGGGSSYHFSGASAVAPERMAPAPERGAPAPERISEPAAQDWRAAEPRPLSSDRAAVGDANLSRGYQGAHPLYGSGARTPWTGHNISAEQFRSGRYPGGWQGRQWNGAFDGRNNFNQNNFYNRNVDGWNSQWNNGGYWGNRPWGYGWYNWSPNSWGWWGNNSLGWGLAALATGEVITDLVNQAANQQSPVIDVPDSNYQLNYGSVDAVGDSGANFSYAVADPVGGGNGGAPGGGSAPIKGAANCQEGLLDGQIPSTASQAQLLNAACQVAYGPDPKGTPLSSTGGFPWTPSPAVGAALTLLLGLGLGVGGYGVLNRRRSLP